MTPAPFDFVLEKFLHYESDIPMTTLEPAAWILPTEHISNPYSCLIASVGDPHVPIVYSSVTHPLQLQAPWIWSGTGFARHLTDDEQDIFNQFMLPIFSQFHDERHPASDSRLLAYLLCTNPPMQYAMARVATYAMAHQAPRSFHQKPPGMLHPSPLKDSILWLSVWPWIPLALREALYPVLTIRWSVLDQLALTLIDPCAPPPIVQSGHVNDYESSLLKHARHIVRQPVSTDGLVDILCAWIHAHPQQGLPTVERLVLTFLEPDGIADVFRRTEYPLFHALECHQTPDQVLSRAICKEQHAYRDSTGHYQPFVAHPYFARIRPIEQILSQSVSHPVRWLFRWLSIGRLNVPRLELTDLPALRACLCQELAGPYADLAEPIWALAFQEPLPTRSYVHGKRPLYEHDIHRLLDSNETPEAGLALCMPYASSPMVAEMLACHQHVTPELIHRMSWHQNDGVRAVTVGHSLLHPDDHRRLSHSTNKRIQAEFISIRRLSPDEIQTYETHPSPTIRGGLAQNLGIPLEVKLALSRDSAAVVREKLVQYNDLPTTILQLLAGDSSPIVRRAVAMRKDCPESILRMMGHDKDAVVRLCLANHPSTPMDILKHLAKRPSLDLAKALLQHPSLDPVDRIRLTLKYAGSGR